MCDILRKFDIDSLYICPPYLYTVTPYLGNPKKSFLTVLLIKTSDYYSISEEANCNFLLQLICLLTIVYCFLLSAQPYSMVSFLLSLVSLFKATNTNPPPSLFRLTNIWRNATLHAIRCKSFTFYKVVWWHFTCVVSKRVTVFFWDNINIK